MPNVYIEPRPKSRPEGDPIDDYVVEDHADHVLATFKTHLCRLFAAPDLALDQRIIVAEGPCFAR